MVLPQCEMSIDGHSPAGAKHAPSSYPNVQMWSTPPEAFQYGQRARTDSRARAYNRDASATRYLVRVDAGVSNMAVTMAHVAYTGT